jgi:hypothetical protein
MRNLGSLKVFLQDNSPMKPLLGVKSWPPTLSPLSPHAVLLLERLRQGDTPASTAETEEET